MAQPIEAGEDHSRPALYVCPECAAVVDRRDALDRFRPVVIGQRGHGTHRESEPGRQNGEPLRGGLVGHWVSCGFLGVRDQRVKT